MNTLDAICKRHSVRSYTGEGLSDAEMNAVLKAAQAAPVGNAKYDTVHLTVITNKEMLGKIDKTAAEFFGDPSAHPLYGAPVLILVSSLITGTPKDKSPISNCSCIVENMSLEAVELGLGTVHIWGAVAGLNTKPELVKELNLPEGFSPVCGIALGKTEEKYTERDIPTDRIKTAFIR